MLLLWNITNDNWAFPRHQSDGGWEGCGYQFYIPKANTSIAWVNLQYTVSQLFTPAGPLLHKNETTVFLTGWEATEVASCRDVGALFTLGCCQTTAKFITSSQWLSGHLTQLYQWMGVPRNFLKQNHIRLFLFITIKSILYSEDKPRVMTSILWKYSH